MLYYMIQRGWFGILLTPICSSAKPAPQVSMIPLLEPSVGSTERQPKRIDYGFALKYQGPAFSFTFKFSLVVSVYFLIFLKM